MCGITGWYNPSGKTNGQEAGPLLEKMCNTIIHRGPDDKGYYIAEKACLGMRRLSIIDLKTGHQPIHNEDKTLWVVFNGEIYNFPELREELEKTHTFYTSSDTEVIIHLYEDYGEKCVEHLRGMFAFAVWDSKRERLFLAKDRIGKKPLYYAQKDGALVFGSEIKCILEYLGENPEINHEAIDLFLTYQYIPSPKTIFKDIFSLPPAHTLVCGNNGVITTSRYWDLDYRKKTALSFSDACLRTKELLEEAVKIRMIADVPLGAFLSGGHDSSIVVGLMSGLSSRPVKTFTIGFEEDDFSELPFARAAAGRFNTEHSEFILKTDFIELLPEIVWHYGQPFADSSALPSYLVSRETRKHVTVALNGDGGDEAFGGYLRYKAMKASLLLSFPFRLMGDKATNFISKMVPNTGTAKGRNMFGYISRLIAGLSKPPAARNIYWHWLFSDASKEILYSDKMKSGLKDNALNYLKNIFENAKADDILDKTYYTDVNSYLPECLLPKMDIASMSNSLEARSPFLDHKVLEFSASLPTSWKLHNFTSKYILKKTFKDFLPKSILNRGKMGFGIPVGRWFRNDWKGYFKEIVLSDKALKRGYFNKAAVENIYNEHVSGKRDHGYRMWALLMLELWHRVYCDKELYQPQSGNFK